MSTVPIDLPDHLKAYLDEQVARRGYGTPSDFVTSLLEAEREKTAHREIEALLAEAVDGPFEDWTESDVDDIRRVGRAIIDRRKDGK